MSNMRKLSIIILLFLCLLVRVEALPLDVKTTVVDDHTIQVSVKNLGEGMSSTRVDILVVDSISGWSAYQGSRNVTFNQNEQKDLVFKIPDLPDTKYTVKTLVYKDGYDPWQQSTYYTNLSAATFVAGAQPSPSPTPTPSASPTATPSPSPTSRTTTPSPSLDATTNVPKIVLPVSNVTTLAAAKDGGAGGGLAIPPWTLIAIPIVGLLALSLFLLLNENYRQRSGATSSDYDFGPSGAATMEYAKTAQSDRKRIMIEDDIASVEAAGEATRSAQTRKPTKVPIEDAESEAGQSGTGSASDNFSTTSKDK